MCLTLFRWEVGGSGMIDMYPVLALGQSEPDCIFSSYLNTEARKTAAAHTRVHRKGAEHVMRSVSTIVSGACLCETCGTRLQHAAHPIHSAHGNMIGQTLTATLAVVPLSSL